MYGSITDAKRRNEKKTAVGNLGGGGVTEPALLALFIEYQVLLMVGGV